MSDMDDLLLREFDEPYWCERCVEYVSPGHRHVVCSLTLPLDVGPLSPNRTLGRHWSVREKLKRITERTAYAVWCKAIKPRASGPVLVTYTIRRARKLDADNALAALKAVTDALFKNRITPDDSPEWVTFNPVVQICHSERNIPPCVEVLVEEIGE